MTEFKIGDDTIDSRDVIKRIEDLEGDKEIAAEALEEEGRASSAIFFDEDDAAELAALQSLAEDGEGYGEDWHHGATLILDSYFEEYARDYADGIGAVSSELVSWPGNHVDWKEAAAELQQDYTAIEVKYNGREFTYWVR